jgi:hypothetical protein
MLSTSIELRFADVNIDIPNASEFILIALNNMVDDCSEDIGSEFLRRLERFGHENMLLAESLKFFRKSLDLFCFESFLTNSKSKTKPF